MAGSMTRTNLLRAPHLRDHRLDMIDRRLRHDPVAEVEDVRAATGGRKADLDHASKVVAAAPDEHDHPGLRPCALQPLHDLTDRIERETACEEDG